MASSGTREWLNSKGEVGRTRPFFLCPVPTSLSSLTVIPFSTADEDLRNSWEFHSIVGRSSGVFIQAHENHPPSSFEHTESSRWGRFRIRKVEEQRNTPGSQDSSWNSSPRHDTHRIVAVDFVYVHVRRGTLSSFHESVDSGERKNFASRDAACSFPLQPKIPPQRFSILLVRKFLVKSLLGKEFKLELIFSMDWWHEWSRFENSSLQDRKKNEKLNFLISCLHIFTKRTRSLKFCSIFPYWLGKIFELSFFFFFLIFSILVSSGSWCAIFIFAITCYNIITLEI